MNLSKKFVDKYFGKDFAKPIELKNGILKNQQKWIVEKSKNGSNQLEKHENKSLLSWRIRDREAQFLGLTFIKLSLK